MSAHLARTSYHPRPKSRLTSECLLGASNCLIEER